jgi:hypothetical protein
MGEQVAFNKALHYTAEVFENDKGEYYVVHIKDAHLKLIRGEYIPIGNRLLYPKSWGKEKAEQVLLDYLIEADETLIEKASQRLDKLKKCKNK